MLCHVSFPPSCECISNANGLRDHMTGNGRATVCNHTFHAINGNGTTLGVFEVETLLVLHSTAYDPIVSHCIFHSNLRRFRDGSGAGREVYGFYG